MKINFETGFKNLDGTALTSEGGKDQATLKNVSVNALLGVFEDERNLSGEKKATRWLLAQRIYANPKEIDLTVEEISEIKSLIGKGYGSLVVGQAFQMLEGK